ncbi:MAG: response regulator [Acidobacteria bacterium]|nr:response regulator [Acidobacteriota bacterium]MBI3661502.1 response regulator [Acidobacteriota bacterium]
MGIRDLLRYFSREQSAAAALAAFSQAAAAGDSLPRLLELAAFNLLTVARAERAGVWIESDVPHLHCGVVLESPSGPVPSEWDRLDLSSFPWKSVLENKAPVIADLRDLHRAASAGETAPVFSPPVLTGMEGAVWWPVRSCGRTTGLALLAFKSGRLRSPKATAIFVWTLLDQLAVAVRAQRERESSELLRKERIGREAAHRAQMEHAAQAAKQAAQDLAATRQSLLDTRSTAAAAPAPEVVSSTVARHAEAELCALLESVESGVLLLDPAGRIRCLNERLAQLFGIDPQDAASLAGRGVEQLFERLAPMVRDPETFARRWGELASLGNSSAWDELELIRPSRRILQRFSRPVSDALGHRLGWLELYREGGESGPSHSRMVQTEKMAAIGQLVSGIAHELNNPLTSIMGYAQLLLARSPGRRAAAERYLDAAAVRDILREAEKIFQEAERAGRIVKNLLLFAREARVVRRAVDLNEIAERTLALRSYELKVENIHVELQLDPTLPPTLADPHQLQQVVLNLLVNAEQAILDGPAGPRPDAPSTADQGHIRVRTFALPGSQPPRLALEVSDNGTGVSPEFASRLFDPFFTTKPMGIGTGLGLSIAYGIVHEHGGEIYLDSARSSPLSEPLGGATFVVELPVFTSFEVPAVLSPLQPEAAELAGDVAVLPPRETSSASTAGQPRSASILVVEDEPTVAQLISDVLKEQGHLVDVVLDSREGLARAGRFGYDLIICDLRMPRLDGRAFYRSLVRAGHPAQHRILFVTGDTLSPRTLDFLKKTGLPYLAKPFLVEELKNIVNRALDSSVLPKDSSPGEPASPNSYPAAGMAAKPDVVPSPFGRRAEELRRQ